MIKMDDYKNTEGDIDWPGYRAAQLANGDLCMTCGTLMMFGKGHLKDCASCKEMKTDDTEGHHSHLVRCPKCRELFNPEEYDVSKEEFNAWCPECDHEFEVGISFEITYSSPEMIKETDDDTEEEDSQGEPAGDHSDQSQVPG